MKFYIFINTKKKNANKVAKDAVKILRKDGIKIYLNNEEKSHNFINKLEANVEVKPTDYIKNVDIIIAIGGDGTTIAASKYAIQYNKPIVGINAGRLGFLTTVEPSQIKSLEKLIKGNYKIKKRMVMEVNKEGKSFFAVNDAVIDRDNSQGIIDIEISKEKDDIIKYRADAVIFSTPIGSTGYALSNGGPVSDPDLNYIAMAPICPHSFNSQSYLFTKKVELNAKIGKNQNAYLLIDGKEVDTVSYAHKVSVKKSNHCLKIIYLDDTPFYKTLKQKFQILE